MTLRDREPRPISRAEMVGIRVATFVVVTLLIFGLLVGVLSNALAIPNCPVTIHPDGTWSPIGWTVENSGALWCELNPDPQPGLPQLRWDYTWQTLEATQ